MKSLKVRALLLVGALAVFAGGLMMLFADYTDLAFAPILPAVFCLACLVFAGVLLWLGLQVARFQDRKKRARAKGMNPLLAARVAVLAQATAITGVALAGWHLPFVVSYLSLLLVRGATASLWVAVADLAGGLILLLAGLWVESMCKIPPADSSEQDGAASASSENPGYAARSGE